MAELIENIFMDSFKREFDLGSMTAEAQDLVKTMSKQQNADFASSSGGHFSAESREFIAKESAFRLVKALSSKNATEVDRDLLQQEWNKIVRDFYQLNFWGQVPQKSKPAKVKTEEQKRMRELAAYIWVAFQAWIVMKLIIFYFGIEAADNPQESHWLLYAAILFSFGSLVLFAWRKFKKEE
ncbi:MAG TPA: hypothetical protein VIG33_17565 [Pseudobdellovibrionaceae bacterium]